MKVSTLALLAGLTIGTTARAQTPPWGGSVPTGAIISPAEGGDLKSPATARVLGILPGAGHMYAGEVRRGFAYLGAVVGILAATSIASVAECAGDVYESDCGSSTTATIGAVAAIGVWGWSIYDAGLAARRTNTRAHRPASLIAEPVRLPTAEGDRIAVRLGLSIPVR
jgi:hypothetical protein